MALGAFPEVKHIILVDDDVDIFDTDDVLWAMTARVQAERSMIPIPGVRGEDGWVGDWRGDAVAFRFQPPPVEPCMRFSRTRLTDILHRRCSAGARQARLGRGATTIPLRETRPSSLGDR